MSDEEEQEWLEAEQRAEHIGRLKKYISKALEEEGVIADPWALEGDIYVEGALSDIVRVYLLWRREVDEELGNG